MFWKKIIATYRSFTLIIEVGLDKFYVKWYPNVSKIYLPILFLITTYFSIDYFYSFFITNRSEPFNLLLHMFINSSYALIWIETLTAWKIRIKGLFDHENLINYKLEINKIDSEIDNVLNLLIFWDILVTIISTTLLICFLYTLALLIACL